MAVLEFGLAERPDTRHLRHKRILSVDRDELWGRALSSILEGQGYHVRMANQAYAAGRLMHHRDFDLVMLSTSLGEDGLVEMLEELRRLRVHPPVLLMSSPRPENSWEPWLFLPCLSILRQPYSIDDVLETVESLLGGPWTDDRA